MNPGSLQRWWPAILPAAGPVAVVLALRMLAPIAGPQPASAAAATSDPAAVPPSAAVYSPGQVEAARHAAARVIEVGMPSPFILPEVPRPSAGATIPPVHQPVASPQPRAEFRLSAIIGGRETVAVINGKVRRVGEEPAPGWKVESIDANGGKVTLRHGELGSLAVSLPGAGGH